MSVIREAIEKLYKNGISQVNNIDNQTKILEEFEKTLKNEYYKTRNSGEAIVAVNMLENYLSLMNSKILDFDYYYKEMQMFSSKANLISTSLRDYLDERIAYHENQVLENMSEAKRLIAEKNTNEIYKFVTNKYNSDFYTLRILYNYLDDSQKKMNWFKMFAISEMHAFVNDFILSPSEQVKNLSNVINDIQNKFDSFKEYFIEVEKLSNDYTSARFRKEKLEEDLTVLLKQRYSLEEKFNEINEDKKRRIIWLIDRPEKFGITSAVSALSYYKNMIDRAKLFPEITLEELLRKEEPVKELFCDALSVFSTVKTLSIDYLPSDMVSDFQINKGVLLHMLGEISHYLDVKREAQLPKKKGLKSVEFMEFEEEQYNDPIAKLSEHEYIGTLLDNLKNSRQNYLNNVLDKMKADKEQVRKTVNENVEIIEKVREEMNSKLPILTHQEIIQNSIKQLKEEIIPAENKANNLNLYN